jgi:hypothetical protein
MSAARLEYSADVVRHSINKAANFVQSISLPLLPDSLVKFSDTALTRSKTFDKLFLVVLNVFDRTKVLAAGRPIHWHKPTITKLPLHLMTSMGAGIVLHEGQLWVCAQVVVHNRYNMGGEASRSHRYARIPQNQ